MARRLQQPPAEVAKLYDRHVSRRLPVHLESERTGLERHLPLHPPVLQMPSPMVEGYDEDDIWMMVEDEFQTLAQSFTAHLHHAEYKRLMKKAKEAPRKELPEPTSPMSKETKRKLQRQARDISNKDVLDRMIGGSKIADDTDEEKVDDPWRGTALAGLISASSQEKTSLKGLEKMPSSTRAARGFFKAETKDRTKKLDAIDLLTRPPEQRNGLKLSPRKPMSNHNHRDEDEDQVEAQRAPRKSTANPAALDGHHSEEPESSSTKAVSRNGVMPSTKAPLQLSKSILPKKRKKVKEESNDDRRAEVPMFLF